MQNCKLVNDLSPYGPCTDHDERISLFLRASESDPELPYAPLLRQVTDVHLSYLPIHGRLALGLWMRKMNSYSLRQPKF